MELEEILKVFDLDEKVQWGSGDIIDVISPIYSKSIGKVVCTDKKDYEKVVTQSVDIFKEWRQVPAPQRGEIVRQIGDAFRQHKKELGALISIEMGKIAFIKNAFYIYSGYSNCMGCTSKE